MVKKILMGLVLVVVLFVIGGFVLPTDYALAREITIDAPPAKVHEFVGDLEVILFGPTGTAVTLVNQRGGSNSQGLRNVLFDDEAVNRIAEGGS